MMMAMVSYRTVYTRAFQESRCLLREVYACLRAGGGFGDTGGVGGATKKLRTYNDQTSTWTNELHTA